jgi:hypothetical protein
MRSHQYAAYSVCTMKKSIPIEKYLIYADVQFGVHVALLSLEILILLDLRCV